MSIHYAITSWSSNSRHIHICNHKYNITVVRAAQTVSAEVATSLFSFRRNHSSSNNNNSNFRSTSSGGQVASADVHPAGVTKPSRRPPAEACHRREVPRSSLLRMLRLTMRSSNLRMRLDSLAPTGSNNVSAVWCRFIFRISC